MLGTIIVVLLFESSFVDQTESAVVGAFVMPHGKLGAI